MHPEQDTVPPFSLSQSQFTTVCVSCNAHLSSGGPDLDDPGRLPMLQLEEVHCVSEKRGKKRREKRKPSA